MLAHTQLVFSAVYCVCIGFFFGMTQFSVVFRNILLRVITVYPGFRCQICDNNQQYNEVGIVVFDAAQ